MNTLPESIFVNSCQYTPIYLIQSPGATQASPYLFTQANVEPQNPVNNLKSFYENSANIAESTVSSNESQKPRIIKVLDNVTTGNNLKLASFLLPKTNNTNKTFSPNNLVLKPNQTVVGGKAPAPVGVPKLDMARKIVKLQDVIKIRDTCKGKEVTLPVRTVREKIVPKPKPKENVVSPPTNATKHTSVQLIKLGETYHSLNELSKDQIKMVNQALKIFSDPEKIAPEPTYDPVTNTKFIYKVVSPKDLTVVGKKRLYVKDIKKEDVKKESLIKKQAISEEDEDEEGPEIPAEPKVTRSGRKVKLPKLIIPEESSHKPKKRNTIIKCFQCSAEFSSLYRLQKHYEFHPTHIPAKIHSNLFHCLLAIIKGSSEEDRTNMFIQQLEQLIVKLKSLLPCLLKLDENKGKSCTINDDIGRLFGMNPGKYSIDVDALTCVKDKDGFCVHNPPVSNTQTDIMLTNVPESIPLETDDCARINSVEKWPTVNKRIWKLKQQKSDELNAKKMRMSESDDTLIELGMEDFVLNNDSLQNMYTEANEDCNTKVPDEDQNKKAKNHIQFHSAHFDIRSSPIKPSSTVFRKFQISSDKLQELQKLSLLPVSNDNQKDCVIPNNSENSINDIFKDIELTCKEAENSQINVKDWKLNNLFEPSFSKEFEKSKACAFDKEIDKVNGFNKEINEVNAFDKEVTEVSAFVDSDIVGESSFDKECVFDNISRDDQFKETVEINNSAFEEIKENDFDKEINDNQINGTKNECILQNQNEMLNFLDSLDECLSYPSTEIRNTAVDFQMDLFS